MRYTIKPTYSYAYERRFYSLSYDRICSVGSQSTEAGETAPAQGVNLEVLEGFCTKLPCQYPLARGFAELYAQLTGVCEQIISLLLV